MKVRSQFNFLWETKCPNLAVVAFRGAGKTFAVLQYMVFSLLGGVDNGSSVFFSGTLGQAKDTALKPMAQITEHFPDGFCRYKIVEHMFEFRLGPNDVRRLYLRGYESKENCRGLHPELIVLDECASLPYNMFGSVITPMLAPVPESGAAVGRLIAIGTARGKNAFYDLWKRGKDPDYPDWESYTIKADGSYIFTKEELERKRFNLTKAEYAQEYECDFEANVFYGSVYGDFLDRFTVHNIDDCYDYDPSLPVWTTWDLGLDDYTAIWFFQVKGDRITFIDYLEDNGHEMQHYADVLFKKPYSYSTCILPFDGFRRDMRGPPLSTQLEKFGFRTAQCLHATEAYGVDKARNLLKVARFNKTKCALGLEHLRSFSYKIDSRTGEKLNATVHNIHSHGADAFRYVATSNSVWENYFNTQLNAQEDFFEVPLQYDSYSAWE
jgi:hypothetical protein